MQIFVYTIEKKEGFKGEVERYKTLARPFAKLSTISVYDRRLGRASDPRKIYRELLSRYLLTDGLNVILTPDGKLLDTPQFTDQLLKDRSKIAFFIGGSYGFEEEFKKEGFNLSLTPLTLSHQLAKLVLVEQIYRGLTILHNHPYHK
ncbi:MAG: 23S rRNA (pseudouridine(1915)-N(3))-methyltransferase RlmH [Epsilonproteobacteria bacterium]|nr:23S rRNA (pseudouridine(1915)-N(3))-methyltransferase RlmH [Campylobacterota bacterium]NPA88771.1 23S rRNA (pseudouridine(1915)-N(3))-methyltransferase RlmH [Campylobacterota bacterium]